MNKSFNILITKSHSWGYLLTLISFRKSTETLLWSLKRIPLIKIANLSDEAIVQALKESKEL